MLINHLYFQESGKILIANITLSFTFVLNKCATESSYDFHVDFIVMREVKKFLLFILIIVIIIFFITVIVYYY